MGLSLLAHPTSPLRTYKKNRKTGKITKWRRVLKRHGIGLHICGSDPFKSKDPDAKAVEIYSRETGNLGQYLIQRQIDPMTGDARIVQLVDDALVCAHAGVDAWQYQAYRDGSWRNARDLGGKISLAARALFDKAKKKDPDLKWSPTPTQMALAWWDARWKKYGFQHPGQIGPSLSNNDDYIGIEIVADEDHPITAAQYRALCALIFDIASRWGLLAVIYTEPGRIVGHADLDAFERWSKRGGWDPPIDFDWQCVLTPVDTETLVINDPFKLLPEDLMPRPEGRSKALARLQTAADRTKYARAGYHAMRDRGLLLRGDAAEAAADAANAYFAAFKTKGAAATLQALAQADHLATEATT